MHENNQHFTEFSILIIPLAVVQRCGELAALLHERIHVPTARQRFDEYGENICGSDEHLRSITLEGDIIDGGQAENEGGDAELHENCARNNRTYAGEVAEE